jgi:hypothetical protein
MANNKKLAPRNTEVFACTSCGAQYKTQRNNFIKSNSTLYVNNNGYITVCKNCLDSLYKRLVGAFNGDTERALKHCCMLFDIYYNEMISAATKDVVPPQTRIRLYPSKLNMIQYKANDKTYLDYVLENLERPTVDVETKEGFEEEKNKYIASEETIRFFGVGYTNEQYEYLQNEYSDWLERYECETKAKEELFKAISIAQLKIHEIQKEQGSPKDLETAVKTFQSLLDSQNITPKKVSGDIGLEQETFGTLIRKLETEQPVSEPQEQWRDVDGINKYIDTWFFGQLCELVDMHNPRETEYFEEKNKYKISPPQQDNDFGGNEATLLERLAKKRVDGDGAKHG